MENKAMESLTGIRYDGKSGSGIDWEHGVAPTSLWIASEDSLPPLQEDVIVYSELLSYSIRHRTDGPNVITDKYGFYLIHWRGSEVLDAHTSATNGKKEND